MKLPQVLAAIFPLCALTTLSAGAEPTPKQHTCEVSKGPQTGGNLRAFLPSDGRLVFHPGGPGFVDLDGALGIKFGWGRPIGSELIVGGRRLDAEAPPARAYMHDGYRDGDFQPTYLVFPTPGCWQITGRIGDQSLTFIVQVEQQGAGPNWKFEGIPVGRGWYQTTLEGGRVDG